MREELARLRKTIGNILLLGTIALIIAFLICPVRWLPWNWKMTEKEWKAYEEGLADQARNRSPGDEFPGYVQ